MNTPQIFPDIEAYSKEIGLSPDILAEAFQLENKYHELLVKETDSKKREFLYDEFYSNLLSFYGRITEQDESLESKIASKDPQVTLFELNFGKSIIDFGCGRPFFDEHPKKLPYKKLTGVDVFIPENLKKVKGINFIASESSIFKQKRNLRLPFRTMLLSIYPLDLP